MFQVTGPSQFFCIARDCEEYMISDDILYCKKHWGSNVAVELKPGLRENHMRDVIRINRTMEKRTGVSKTQTSHSTVGSSVNYTPESCGQASDGFGNPWPAPAQDIPVGNWNMSNLNPKAHELGRLLLERDNAKLRDENGRLAKANWELAGELDRLRNAIWKMSEQLTAIADGK